MFPLYNTAVVLKLVGGTETCKFYAGIYRTLCWNSKFIC